MDFHASSRTYNRQGEGKINIRLGDSDDQQSRFLYGWQNKYQNLKTRLSEELVRARLRGEGVDEPAPLESSIKDLFRTFFPDKSFRGIEVNQRTGDLRFDVELSTGELHDIEELSSGEKEIVYGYLWLRTATPPHSVVLIDEPELHLNPALVQGLPEFYQAHLGDALEAQVWIVTHSDAILRTAARTRGMKVFHVARATGDGTNQAASIDTGDAVETAVIDLIGDLAAYRPHATIVLVEGSSDTRFDVAVIRSLFPELAERANFIPAGNRRGTERAAERLLDILVEAGLSARAVSLCDGDHDQHRPETGNRLHWPVYEIENFLLDPTIMRNACVALTRHDPFGSDEAVTTVLRELAADQLDLQVAVLVQDNLNDEFVSAIEVGFGRADPVGTIERSAAGSAKRVASLDISASRISQLFDEGRRDLKAALESDDFLTRFPGDRLVGLFAGRVGVSTESFKNVLLDTARSAGYRPPAMEATLLRAIASGRPAEQAG